MSTQPATGNLPPDALQRQQALDASQSFLCEAPAGSGKTELLTQRMLVLLARVQKPEEILAITFTRKATGEMRERVLQALQMAEGPEPEEAHKQLTWQLAQAVLQADQQQGWQLRENPNRLQILTFDGLCAGLSRQLPLESAFGAQAQIADDSEELYRKAVRSLLASLEDDCDWADSLAVLLELLDNRFDRFESLMMQMLAKREQWLPLLGWAAEPETIRRALSDSFAEVIEETVTRIHALIPPMLQEALVSLAGFAASNLQQAEKASPTLACLNMDVDNKRLPGSSAEDRLRWHGLVNLLLTQKGEWRKNITVRDGFPAAKGPEKTLFDARKQHMKNLLLELQSISGLGQAFNDLLALPGNTVDEQQWRLLQALFQVLPVLAAQLTLAFRDSGQLDYSEVSLGARRALGSSDEPSQLAMRMDYRLSHILVDEFQDTSAAQIELLNQLTAGWSPDDGRTLFCVGDAMQSIYSFRGANVGLFLNARAHGLQNVPLTPLQLTANFRSQGNIVEWVNHTFARAFPETSDISSGAVSYAASDAVKPALPGAAVSLHGFIDDKGQAEAETLVELIQQARKQDQSASIAVLVRSRTALLHTLPLLQAAGLGYRAVELQALAETPVVEDLLSLTRALLHPADRTAWLCMLRAPWCGLSLAELQFIASLPGASSNLAEQCKQALTLAEDSKIPDFSPQSLARLERTLAVLLSAQSQRNRKPLRNWVEGCWLRLGGAACAESAQALEDSNAFFSLLETWPYPADLPGFRHLQNAVTKLYAAPDPNADERLQIMTVHKSKGLQFDVVIVPGLARRGNNRFDELMLWHQRLNANGELKLLMSPQLRGHDGEYHPNYKHLVQEAKKKIELETCRLLYVACTRAKQRLHLCFSVSNDSKKPDNLKPPSANTMLHSIWPAIELQVQRYESKGENAGKTGDLQAGQEKPLQVLQRLPNDWPLPRWQGENPLQDYIPPYDYDQSLNQAELSWQTPDARSLGTLIHAYLQRMGQEGLQHWSPERIANSQPLILAGLQQLGCSSAQLENISSRAVQILQQVLTQPKAREILRSDYPFSEWEYAITLTTTTGPMQLVMDRVYTDQQGQTWVVDYKTAQPEQNQTLGSFFEQQQALYAAKMELYRNALQSAGFQSVNTALFFPVIGEWLGLSQAT